MSPIEVATNHIKEADPILASIIKNHPLPSLAAHTNYYQELVESIIGQQLSVKAARTIRLRFIALFDNQFPSPEQILSSNTDQLRTAGLSRPKISYIQDLATRVYDKSLQLDQLDHLTNDEIIKELTAVKGIGEWTVHMFLMFCMGRLDVLPTGDLGIRTGVKLLYSLDHLPIPAEVTSIARTHNWHPYESVASWYIWRALDNNPN